MQLLIAAGGVAIARSVIFAVWTSLLRRSGDYRMYRFLTPLQTLLAVIIGGVLIAATVMIAQQKRPGHAFALGAAIAGGLSLVISVAFMLVPSLIGRGLVSLSLVASLVSAGTVVSLSLCLRELGRSRERPVDPFAFAAIGLAALSLVWTIVARGGVYLGDATRYVGPVLSIAAQGSIIAMAVRIMSYVPATEFAFGDPSAYRGPQGVYPMGAVPPAGSAALGFLAGFFGGCIGLGLVLMLAKGAATKRGAGIGFACQTVVGLGLRAAAR